MLKYLIISVFSVLIFLYSCTGDSNKKNLPREADGQAIELNDELTALNEKIRNDNENDELYISRAKYYLKNRKTDSAMRDILFALDINPENSEHYVTLSDAYLMLGNPDKCKNALDKAIDLDAGNKEALLKLAELFLIMKKYKGTFETIDKILKIDAVNPLAYFIRAYAFLENGDTTGAIKDFKNAAYQDQEYYDAYMQLGLISAARKEPVAVDYFNNAINIAPDNVQPYYQLGLFYQKNNQIEKAVSTYISILQINPGFIFAIYNLGYISLVYIQDFETAIDYFTRVIDIDPQYAEAYFNRGYCYELLNEMSFAKKDYKKTLELKTNYPGAIDGLNRLDNTGN